MAFVLLAIGGWYLLKGADDADGAAAPKVVQLGDTVCDQFLATMPPPGPERIEAGKPCKESLPTLPADDQLRILNHYAAQMDGYIPEDEIQPLIANLDKDASLPLRAHAIYAELVSKSKTVDERLEAIHQEALASGNRIAEAHILFSKKIRPFMNSASPITDGDFDAALQISIEEGMHGFTPHVHNVIGRLHRDKDKYADSVESYILALEGFEKNEDKAGQAKVFSNLSVLYYDFYDYEKSTEYAQSAITLFESSGSQDYSALKNTYIRLSNNMRELGRYEEAFAALEEAGSPETGPPEAVYAGAVESALAFTLYAAGRHDEAFEVVERILASDSTNQTSGFAKSLRAWGASHYMEQGDLSAAERHFNTLVQIAASEGKDIESIMETTSSAWVRTSFADQMVALSIALDRKDDALTFLRISNELDAKHIEEKTQKAVAGHALQTTLRERDESLEKMEVKAANAQLQLTASRSQLALAAFTALALGIIAFIAYRSFRTQQRLTAEKNTYLDEIHHRTKNNFQVLSSILRLDIRRSDAVDQGEADEGGGRRLDAVNRLETMALVHDHIYSLDASKDSDADLGGFVDDLLALLDSSLGRDDVTLEWNVDGGAMDVTRLTPFGLLLCELITNSYKHAFADTGGTITIDIVGDGGTRKMTLKDDGKGFDLEAARNKPGSLGMGLIFDLADQVGGELTVEASLEGTVWTFR